MSYTAAEQQQQQQQQNGVGGAGVDAITYHELLDEVQHLRIGLAEMKQENDTLRKNNSTVTSAACCPVGNCGLDLLDDVPSASSVPPEKFFHSADRPRTLVVDAGDTEIERIDVEDVTKVIQIALRCVYGYVKQFGNLSVVVTQAKSDKWHAAQEGLKRKKTVEEENQWILCGYGRHEVVMSSYTDAVCRHNPDPGRILRIPDVSRDERTKDSWYTQNGLKAYCGMRMRSIPECSLCVLWVKDLPNPHVVEKASAILQDVMGTVEDILDNVIVGITKCQALKLAETQIEIEDRQKQYVFHEIKNQLAPLAVINREDEQIDPDTLSTALNVVFSIMKDPSDVALNFPTDFSFVDPKMWFDRLASFAKQAMRKDGVVHENHYESSYPAGTKVNMDWNKLRQVVVNVLLNAKKFTDKGQTVLTMRVTPTKESMRAEVDITMEDTGCGIREEDVGRVTDMFVQVGPHETRNLGTGMGLSICKAIVERLHAGKLTVQSKHGSGTTIKACVVTDVSLPPS